MEIVDKEVYVIKSQIKIMKILNIKSKENLSIGKFTFKIWT